ncbi:MAG: NCS2 family permease [Candidatus Eisenbacteria bacterium]|nr:NCS2 family permease [Candidatus Eisenbacteria bacterium]
MERLFHLRALGTNVRTELFAGTVTFVTMAYVIFVNPVILAPSGIDFDAVMVATCLAAAVATIFMGLVANYPIALAAGMGENVVFASFCAVGTGVITWQQGLGAVLISGLVFFLLTLLRVRQMMIDAIPDALKHAIAVGIGAFIAFLGLTDAGLVIKPEGVAPVHLGSPANPAVWTAMFGLLLVGTLMARRVRGAILWSILGSAVFALILGVTRYQGLFAPPPSLEPTFLQLSLRGLLTSNGIMVVVVFLFMDVFDSLGTFVGVGQAGGFLKDGKLPRATRALMADATGTVVGAGLGTSTVTSYIESAAGVSAGARSGLASVATGLLFVAAIFLSPLVRMIGEAYVWEGGYFHPITAPALIAVGALMMGGVRKIPWDDGADALPALLVILGIPLTFSVADGLAMGFISYPLIRLLAGRGREVPRLIYILAALFLARYIFLPGGPV